MIFGFICSAIGAVCSAVSGVCSAVGSIGSAFSSFVSGVGLALTDVLMTNNPMADLLSKLVTTVMQALGIIEKEEKVEDIGERALQAKEHGITPEKFENFEEYMQKLRDFEVDPEKSEQRNPVEKLMAGLAVTNMSAEEKLGVEKGSLNSIWVLPIANPEYFTADRMESLMTSGRFDGDSLKYLENNLSGAESRAFEKSLEIDVKDTGTLYEALDKARTDWAALSRASQQGEV